LPPLFCGLPPNVGDGPTRMGSGGPSGGPRAAPHERQ
jgi:hypothetical protein